MSIIKRLLEKTTSVWVIVSLLYVAVFFAEQAHQRELSVSEIRRIEVVEVFSKDKFPPTLGILKQYNDWGNLGFYALYGKVSSFFQSASSEKKISILRGLSLALMLLSFWGFTKLGHRFIYRNRLNPLYVSVGLIVFAINPVTFQAATSVEPYPALICFLLFSMLVANEDDLTWYAVLSSAAVLVDWRALLFCGALILDRATGDKSKLIRLERIFAYLSPFIVEAFLIGAWEGVVPQGQAREGLTKFMAENGWFHYGNFSYALICLAVYPLLFSWALALRARSRALMLGIILTAIFIPIYFLLPITEDKFEALLMNSGVSNGMLDSVAGMISGEYKNFFLFIPWLVGAYLFAQLIFLDALDRSRWLRFYILFYFIAQVFVVSANEFYHLMIWPAVIFLSLTEPLVGEEGKLS